MVVLGGFEAVECIGGVSCEVPDVGGSFPVVMAAGVVDAGDRRMRGKEGEVEFLALISEPGVAVILSKRVMSLGTTKDSQSRPKARRS